MAHEKFVYAVNRRRFFPALLKELFVIADAAQGKQSFQLTELGNLPTVQLATIVPVVNSAFEISVADGFLCSQNRRTGQHRQHFLLEPANVFVFNQFNGNTTLAEVGRRLADEMGWEAEAAFRYSSDLFLMLVRCQVCLPRDPFPPDLHEG